MGCLAIILATTLAIAAPASAKVFDFSYTGPGIDASGTFTTTDTPDADGFYTITSIDGTRNGIAMTLLPPGSYPADGPNDNLVQPNANMVDFGGVSFSTDQDYNVYQAEPDVYDECFGGCDALPGNDVVLTTFSVTAVPEAAVWALVLAGVAGIGGALRSRRKLAVVST
jgi:hypothetical protein